MPLPPMVNSAIKRMRDISGVQYFGQFSLRTNEKRGIIRKFSAKGDFVSEQLVFGKTRVGLSRHIDRIGCVIYLV